MGNLGTGCIRTRGMVLDAETRRRGGRRGEDGRERRERGVSGDSWASRRGIWRTGRKKSELRQVAGGGGLHTASMVANSGSIALRKMRTAPEVESDGKPGDRLHQDSRDAS